MRMKTLAMAALAMALLCSAPSRAASMLGYEPEADPFDQYHEAVARAQAENKLVLVIAGGDWCSWCHRLNKFMKANADVSKSMDATFVVVKVYVGEENLNEFFFSQLPEARGAPHFWVISPEKHVLSSQSTAKFEHKKGYDKAEFLGFVDQWKKHAAATLVQRHASN
jgi:thioredoxin-related protein